MAIKEVRQSGNSVLVKMDNSTTSLNGTLIGYTQKAIFIKNNKTVFIYQHKSSMVAVKNIPLSNNLDPKMFGNKVGINNGNGRYNLFDEDGRTSGSIQA